MNFRNMVFALVLGLASISAFATTNAQAVDTTQLSPELQKQIDAELAKKNTALPEVSTLNEWATLGKNIAEGLGAAAKELGVAVNDFANTDTGKLVTFLLVWKFFGAEFVDLLSSYLIGIPAMIALFWLGTVMVRRATWKTVTIVREPSKVLWGLLTIHRVTKHVEERDRDFTDTTGWQAVFGYGFMIVAVIGFIILI